MSLRLERFQVASGDFTVRADHLEIAGGEIVGLMGPSGAGKTTLLHGIAGFLAPKGGEVWNGGAAVGGLPPEQRRIALVFQRAALFPHLTVAGNVDFGLRLQRQPRPERERRRTEWLERLAIGELAGRYPHEISEGQAQRVALARALVTGFPTLLLDEPFSALDPELRAGLRATLQTAVRETGTAVLMVTHHPDDAEAIVDRVLTIADGSVSPFPVGVIR